MDEIIQVKPDTPPLWKQSLTEVVEGCRAEQASSVIRRVSSPGYNQDFPYSVELFRRAFEGDSEAWDAIYIQFSPLVRRWGSVFTVDVDDVVQDTFIKFMQAAPEYLRARDNLSSILMYLRKTTRDIALRRRRKMVNQLSESGFLVQSLDNSIIDPAQKFEERVEEMEFIRTLLQHADGFLFNDRERIVFQLLFIEAMNPRQILQAKRELFTDISELRIIIQRLHRRLAKNQTIQEMLDRGTAN